MTAGFALLLVACNLIGADIWNLTTSRRKWNAADGKGDGNGISDHWIHLISNLRYTNALSSAVLSLDNHGAADQTVALHRYINSLLYEWYDTEGNNTNQVV